MYFDIILHYAVQKIEEKRKVTYCINTKKNCWNGSQHQILSSIDIFHFSVEALKVARKRRGKPRLDQRMRSNLEPLQKSVNQECNKVARSGRKIEQNEVPKPGPQK